MRHEDERENLLWQMLGYVCAAQQRYSRILTSMQFLTGNIHQRNDLYLDELQDHLSSRLGVNVSNTTIWQTLHNRGFTMKKVCLAL